MIIEQKKLFNHEECEEIIYLSKINPQKWNSSDRKYNSSTIVYNEHSKWIYDKLKNFFEETSNQVLITLKKEIHFHTFDENDKFDLHNDALDRRIFSVGVLLNDDFVGGDFNLYVPSKITLDKVKGNCYIFDASISHEITPILSGIRNSLIWFIQDNHVKISPKKII